MAHIRDFEPILPDPQPYVEKALALYERVVREKRGRIVFIAAELGGGKTDLLNALAQALHQAKPEPNFVAGFFRGGEYSRYDLDCQQEICITKAIAATSAIASLLGHIPSLYTFAASLIGQFLEASVSAREFADEFQRKPPDRKESAGWLKNLLRRAAEEKPTICLLDDWDEAQRFYWDDMLLSLSREIAQDLPLLLFVTVKEPINLAAPDTDESGLTMVIKTLTEKGLAERWLLRKLTHEEVAASIGPAAPGLTTKLHGVTRGNARWVRELWREWRLSEIVVTDEADRWVWGQQHKTTLNLYEDILKDRLTRLLKTEKAMDVEDAREVLACAALEGVRFTADAVALTLGWDRDELIDFLDETLVQSEDNPDGLLLEDDNVNIPKPDGATRTLWRYSFVSELHWLALERYGFANERRPDKRDSEKLEKTAALVKALEETYAPEERLVAAPLARLLRDIGHREAAQHYQGLADYSANREAMREHAVCLLAVNKVDWEEWWCGQAARFLIEAGRVMLGAFSYDETLAVLEEASELARRAKSERDEAYARYLCGAVLRNEGDTTSAAYYADGSLDIFSRMNDKAGMAASLGLRAEIDYAQQRYDDARRRATQSLKIEKEIGNPRGIAGALHELARINSAESRYDDARGQAKQSLKINRKIGDREGAGASLLLLGEIDLGESRYDDARGQAKQSLEINRKIGDRAGAGASLLLLGEIDLVESRYDDARMQAIESLEIHQEIDSRDRIARSLYLLTKVDYAEGQYDDARMQAAQSLKINQEIGNRQGTALTLDLLASIGQKLQRPKEAFDLFALGVLILTEIGHTDVQKIQNNLADLVVAENYGEEQLVEMNQQVLDAYRKDGGKELIENALARLREADR